MSTVKTSAYTSVSIVLAHELGLSARLLKQTEDAYRETTALEKVSKTAKDKKSLRLWSRNCDLQYELVSAYADRIARGLSEIRTLIQEAKDSPQEINKFDTVRRIAEHETAKGIVEHEKTVLRRLRTCKARKAEIAEIRNRINDLVVRRLAHVS